MAADQPRSRRRRDERGSASLFVAAVAVAILVVIGLAYDGGEKFRAAADANTYAQQAARAGAQVLDTGALLTSGTVALQGSQAVAAAQDYLNTPALRDAGVTGTAQITGATTLSVTVTLTRPTAFLGLIGIASQTVTATATATLLHGVTAPQ